MDLRRLRLGEWATALAGLALLVSLFLPWYDSASAWESFAVNDVILALVALAALAIVPVTAAQPTPAVPLAMQSLLCLVGLVALVLVVIRLLSLPGDAEGREVGAWLGLLATLAIMVGAAMAMRDERLSEGDRQVDLTGRPVASQPEIETVPAPRP
jgi:hypothetical protein